jgi:dihydroneopterin aldolase
MAKERQPESAAAEATKPKAAVTYQVSEQPSTRVQEEEFAKQLRLARYLAGASLGRPRDIQKAQTTTKQKPRAKAQPGNKKGVAAELARESRRAQPVSRQKGSSAGPARSEKQRFGPGR